MLNATSEETNCTEQVVRAINLMNPDWPEKRVINDAILVTISTEPQGGWLDSHAIATCITSRRRARGKPTDWTQTRDYVQHVLREAAHVCRHADEYFYRMHTEEVCSPECEEIFFQNPRIARRESCEFCFLELTTAGECPIGC